MEPPVEDLVCADRTEPLTVNDLLEAAPILIVCLNATRRHVPLRAVTFAIDATLPVRDDNDDLHDGVEPGEDVPPHGATPAQIEAVRLANQDRARRTGWT